MKPIEMWCNTAFGELKSLQTIRVLATIEPKCNLTCEHCYWAHDIPRATARDWTQQVAFLKQLNVPLFFVGRILNERGAIFLRHLLQEQGTRDLGIVDNGLTILDYPEFFPHYGTINISIDGWQEHHDRQRNRKGLFKEAWETVLELKNQGLDPIISAAISPITMDEWEKFEGLLCKHGVPMSATTVMAFEETAKRGTAVFTSKEVYREAFKKLLNGMPKLINLYGISDVEMISDLLLAYQWSPDLESGDCIKATLPSRTILVYRPMSLANISELALEWDGVFKTPGTYSQPLEKDSVNETFFKKIQTYNEQEVATWSRIAPYLFERR